MESLMELLEELKKQEEELIFNTFNSDEAWKLGNLLVQLARQKASKPVAIGITMNQHTLFYYAFDGTTPDNDVWIRRKENSVYRFYKSTYHLGVYVKLRQDTIFNRYAVSPQEFAQMAGGFPIRVKGMGVVGTVSISGMSDIEDHEMAVEGIRTYLSEQNV